MKSARRIFGQVSPAPTFFVKVAQHFNAGQLEPKCGTHWERNDCLCRQALSHQLLNQPDGQTACLEQLVMKALKRKV